MPGFEGRLYESLRQAGLPDVPESFSIAVVHQEISRAIVTEIERFIRVFDRITTRPVWQEAVTATAPPIARGKRSEVCFFSAWDFHLPPERPERWQLIECNDNGSGLLFAALLNRLYYEVSGIGERRAMEAPMPFSAFAQRVTDLIRTEAEAFFGAPRAGLVLILDDEDSVRRGRFRHELVLLRDVCRRAGCHSEVASPVDTTWDGSSLLCGGERVSFVVNRSTDFFWEAPVFAPLRAAYAAGGVYVAPNPFSYATRSDKGLLERLGSPVGDADLGIRPDERLLLSDHVPETRRLRPDNVEELARDKEQWFFKPCHGFASRGVLTGAQVGRARLRRLLKKGDSYVAQRRVAKSRLDSNEGVPLWADLRVWAYRGERLLLSGRASRHADTMDLSPPGGWLPTYAQT
jgi:hypothetical protein